MRLRTTAQIALLLLAGCARSGADEPAGKAAPAALPPPEAFAPPPAGEIVESGAVLPMSNTAMAGTGAALFKPGAYSFAKGQSYAVAPEAKVSANVQWSADGGSWADLLGVDPGGEVEVVRVTAQTVDPARAPNGSLCGSRPVRWIATGRSADDVGAEVMMAAFSGARPPGPLGRDEDLCGTYNYAAGN